MIRSWFRHRSRTAPAPSPSPSPWLPEGLRVYAIGDVHGRLDCLDALLAAIERDMQGATVAVKLVFLGDLIDRGPDSRGVVARVRGLGETHDRAVIMGNHEELLLLTARGDRAAAEVFARVGGRATLASYGADPARVADADADMIVELIRAHVADDDLAFIGGFENKLAIGDYRFVHAGVRPGRTFERQVTADLRWIRRPFLTATRPFDGFVVHGHTVTAQPDETRHRLGIDTGAYRTGRLTAVAIEADRRRFVTVDLGA